MIAIIKIFNPDKLNRLANCDAPFVCEYIVGSKTYDDAARTLEKQYIKHKGELHVRYVLPKTT